MNSIVKELEESYWLSKDAAEYVCTEFYRGITERKWSFAPIVDSTPVMDLDVHQSVTIRNEDRNAKMAVPVNVDGRTVNIKLPESVTNGQTVRFPGKGKVDPRTGKAGDIYVTINIYTNPPQKSKIGVIIAAIAAVALIIGLLIAGSNKPQSGNGPNSDLNISAKPNDTHTHVWRDASCETPKTCNTCGATEGSKLGHDWMDVAYDATKICVRCGELQEEPLTLEPKSIADFSISTIYGKLWVRSDSDISGNHHSKADAPECWSDWSIWGYTSGLVKDNKGNQYDCGIHVDGDKSENYYYEIRLNGCYTTFSGICACPAKETAISSYVYNTSKKHTKYFEVYGDGKLLYTSAPMRYDYSPQAFTINVSGVQVLRIQYPSTKGPNEIATLFDGVLS